MGGLIEIAGVEFNAIDALLYVWFVLASLSTAYVVWDQFVGKNPDEFLDAKQKRGDTITVTLTK